MKTLKLIALAACALLFSQCKTTAPTQTTTPSSASLLEVVKTLDTTQKKFLQFADSTSGNPWKAIMLTSAWVKAQPNVQAVDALDSTYINIRMNSGLQTTFSFDLKDGSGHSLFKGGGASDSSNLLQYSQNDILAKNKITNKKVLLYLPGFSQFYTAGQIQHILDYFTNSGLGLDVTVLKDGQCSYQTVDKFGDYGLVIIDTHGGPDCFLTGSSFSIFPNLPTSGAALDAIIVSQLGQDCVSLLSYEELRLSSSIGIDIDIPLWQQKVTVGYTVSILVTTKYLEARSPMSGTIVFGNMCYSGQRSPNFFNTTSIGTAFSDVAPTSYYGFAHADGTSASVGVPFSNAMLDTFVRALVINNDSTGRAHLKSDGTEFSDYTVHPPYASLLLKHSGEDNYSYLDCIKNFTDSRDGHVYKAVCIGNQTWMAENLDYDVPGSYDYNNDPANGKIYGKLYNFATLMQGAAPSTKVPSGVQGVCPPGWHVPSDSEFAALKAFVSAGNTSAGGPLKSTSSLWQTPNTGATNSTGFSALPGGIGTPPTFSLLGQNAFFNTSTATISPTYTAPTIYSLSAFGNGLSRDVVGDAARSCRCVKDP